jgi:hypothetical protein
MAIPFRHFLDMSCPGMYCEELVGNQFPEIIFVNQCLCRLICSTYGKALLEGILKWIESSTQATRDLGTWYYAIASVFFVTMLEGYLIKLKGYKREIEL